VASVRVARASGATNLSWAVQPPPVANYDVVSGFLSMLRADRSVIQASCLGTSPAPAMGDPRSDPSPGDGFYYLVRAQGICGTGTYGSDSLGIEREPAAPCP
jgi:hypothetical protein